MPAFRFKRDEFVGIGTKYRCTHLQHAYPTQKKKKTSRVVLRAGQRIATQFFLFFFFFYNPYDTRIICRCYCRWFVRDRYPDMSPYLSNQWEPICPPHAVTTQEKNTLRTNTSSGSGKLVLLSSPPRDYYHNCYRSSPLAKQSSFVVGDVLCQAAKTDIDRIPHLRPSCYGLFKKQASFFSLDKSIGKMNHHHGHHRQRLVFKFIYLGYFRSKVC